MTAAVERRLAALERAEGGVAALGPMPHVTPDMMPKEAQRIHGIRLRWPRKPAPVCDDMTRTPAEMSAAHAARLGRGLTDD